MPGTSIQAGAPACYWPLAGLLFTVNAVSAAALPLPLAGEGWGEGVSSSESPLEERTLTRHASRVCLSRKRERRRQQAQLAAAVVTVSRWRFMTILLSAPR
ncbi:hypothetical protein FXB40_44550 [Bradyrhizobium rifense]|uniref:Uncharacterized protein n=1 Tax=Bradyrhizobium rifense TaxID=515499 RepID=A0A5D3K0U9_9BRAD|nr:hypothetical protein FXB40_44550 [Bradyrhizobium rifense]